MKSDQSKEFSYARTQFFSDYGMALVLLLLCVLFSGLTIKEQHPTGSVAGEQVAKLILADQPDANVLIVARATSEDQEFAKAAKQALEDQGATVLGSINGEPGDVRRMLQQFLDREKSVDAIAATDVTAKWSVYDRFDSVGNEKCVTPRSYQWPVFLKLSNVIGVLNQTAIYAIIAIGMTMVIITGGIDLGVGSLVALSAVTSSLIVRDLGGGVEASLTIVIFGMSFGILICAVSGIFVGNMVTRFQLPPFIVTLGIMMMASGLSFRLSNGQSISALPESFFWLGGMKTMEVPNPVWLMIVLYVIAHMVMSQTVFGRYVYAIGGNKEAARLSGCAGEVDPADCLYGLRRVVWFGWSCTCLAVGGWRSEICLMYELEVIAAVVVGGTSLMGGQGKIFGTLIGAFIIAVIKNGMNLMNVDPFNQRIVLGAVLLAAVLLDQLKRRTS